MLDAVKAQYRELLYTYSIYFNKLKIGALTTHAIQKEQLAAAHVYLRVLNYYIDAVEKDLEDKIPIDELQAEDIYLKITKVLTKANQVYYE